MSTFSPAFPGVLHTPFPSKAAATEATTRTFFGTWSR